jgi:hypothetical protein
MWRRVVRYKSTDVSEEHTDYIFRVEDKAELFFDSLDRGSRFSWNVTGLLPNCAALHPRRSYSLYYYASLYQQQKSSSTVGKNRVLNSVPFPGKSELVTVPWSVFAFVVSRPSLFLSRKLDYHCVYDPLRILASFTSNEHSSANRLSPFFTCQIRNCDVLRSVTWFRTQRFLPEPFQLIIVQSLCQPTLYSVATDSALQQRTQAKILLQYW